VEDFFFQKNIQVVLFLTTQHVYFNLFIYFIAMLGTAQSKRLCCSQQCILLGYVVLSNTDYQLMLFSKINK